jgi:hypothetical protein
VAEHCLAPGDKGQMERIKKERLIKRKPFYFMRLSFRCMHLLTQDSVHLNAYWVPGS